MVICILTTTGQPPADSTTSTTTPDSGNWRARLDIAPIQAAVQHYFENGLASSTQRCYNAGQQRYIQFCTQASPTTEHTMSLFAVNLALQGITHSTIKVYFYSIGNLHLSCSQHNAYNQALTPQILRGIKENKLINTHNEFAVSSQGITSLPSHSW